MSTDYSSVKMISDYPNLSKNEKDYLTLICLIISVQTLDATTHSTMKFMIEEQLLSMDTIMKTDTATI